MAKLNHTNFSVDVEAGGWQPKRKNNWYMQFTPPGSKAIEAVEIKSTGLPGGSFSEIEIKYMNSKYYFPGVWTWDTIEMTLRDFVGSSHSTTKKIYDWFKHNFNPESGAQNMAGEVKVPISINLTTPRGQLIETWTLNGAWLQAAKWGEATMDDEQPRELMVTIRYDYATLVAVDFDSTFNVDIKNESTSDDTPSIKG